MARKASFNPAFSRFKETNRSKKGVAVASQVIDRSLGPDSTIFVAPKSSPIMPTINNNAGIAPDHNHDDWHVPQPDTLSAARGLDMALSKVTNPTAVAALNKAKARKGEA
jgi:hypothetical protein